MKKLLLIIMPSTLIIGLCIFFRPNPKSVPTLKTLRGPVLIDRMAENNLNMTLFYSDLFLSQIEAYHINSSQMVPLATTYTSFTEGFIEADKNTLLLEAVNHYRKLKGLDPITYYHNYKELSGYGFLSLTEGLNTLYIIDLSNYEVTCPTFNAPYALERQYIYHITEGQDVYYILTAEANGYKAYWYTLSKDDFSVSHSKKLSPPSEALQIQHYALDPSGNAYFIGNNSLLIVTPEESIYLPLQFNPDALHYADGKVYIFSISELFLQYVVYESELGLTDSGQVNLPNKFVTLVSYEVKDDILYTVTYDSSHPLYRNYITLYRLTDNIILYCLPLKTNSNVLLSLQGAHYH